MAKTKTDEISVEEKLKALFELQQVDSKIDKIKTVRGELPLEVRDLEDLVAGLETRITNLTEASRAEFEYLGDVKGKEMIIDDQSFGTVAEAKQVFDSALGNLLK